MIKIEKVNNRTVYDITVKENSNFYANNILVHNCAEILEATGKIKHPNGEINDHIAVCNLASIALPKFVKKTKKSVQFDLNKLYEVAYQATINLNRVIDVNKYPVDKAEISNRSTRPIGLGVQGLADVFFLYNIPYESPEAKELNKDIFETIYYAACKASSDLAEKEGPYEFWEGSPASKGILQFDLWGVTPKLYNWEELKERIKITGMRNSLHTALMPTASTSSIFGNEASTEAQTSNMYSRRVLSGEFIIVNKHLVKDLNDVGLWSEDMRQLIITNNGSIQNINAIPQHIKNVYKTAWEISQKVVIEMYQDRGAYIDQTQSMNIFMKSPNFAKLTAMHFYGWGGGITGGENPKWGTTPEKALKTGMYYLRSTSSQDAVKFTVQQTTETVTASQDDDTDCLMCSS